MPIRTRFMAGSRVRTSAIVGNINGVPYDPAAGALKVTVRSLRAGRAITRVYVYPTDAEIVRDGLGRFHFDIYEQLGGAEWIVQWANTDAGNESLDEISVSFGASQLGA